MPDDILPPDQLRLMADALALAAAAMTATAALQVVVASSSALSAALLAVPVHQANANTAELATTAKSVDLILGARDPAPAPQPATGKLLGLLDVMKANAGKPVVT
jgi:hypothetical protein